MTPETACRRRINAKNSHERKHPTALPGGASVRWICNDLRHSHDAGDARHTGRLMRRLGRRMAEAHERRWLAEIAHAFEAGA